ncbi:calmodulin-like isoform X1 [Mytilus edulis]|uniref:calmodulin-like isoform X1 n=1 Tax=Mytilus edulis TaxID=6550 RepID=UPI0039F12E0F
MTSADNLPLQYVTDPKEQLNLEFKEAFLMVDKTDTGIIPKTELGKCVRALGLNPPEIEISAIQATVDPEGNETIDYETFLSYVETKSKEVHPDDELREALRVFDRDDNGYISAEELKRMMLTSGESLTEEEADEMMKLADKEGNGRVNYDDFVNMMLSV